jgi:hypothetical protein
MEIIKIEPKYTKSQVYMWDYRDLENLITTFYDIKEFSIPLDQECGNDVCLKFVINENYFNKEENRSKLKKEINDYINPPDDRQYMPSNMTRLFLEDLTVYKVIEGGVHIVDISW